MRSTLAKAIRDARVAAGLTQKQLGARLGLNERAIHRWETGHCAPRRRVRSALVTALQQVNSAAGSALGAVFASVSKGRAPDAAPTPAPAAPPPLDPKLALELATFALAEELNVPARQARLALGKWYLRLVKDNVPGELLQPQLKAWGEGPRASP
jgi:transcriptional regulator with XRE-family HTH domain